MNIDLRLGDCIEVLKTLPDNSVDSVITDPPYHLTSIVKRFGKEDSSPAQFGTDGAYSSASKGFMGKEWDGGDIAFRTDVWEECLRILKPGGHLLAFSHSRTYHRMGVAIEDAGFEIRDQIMWVYGSGFPKSHNIGKAIDKRGGNNHLTQEVGDKLKEARESRNITKTQADELFCNGTTNYMWFEGRSDGIRLPDDISFEKICNEWEELKPYKDLIKSANREVIGQYDGDMGGLGGERLGQSNGDITIAATEAAKNWEGWGTALKPAHEPIVLARKPLSEKSIAENVLKHGTGGINIDGSRIEMKDKENINFDRPRVRESVNPDWILKQAHDYTDPQYKEYNESGRFPANIIFDEEAGQLLDEQSGKSKTKANKNYKHSNTETESNTFTGRGTYTPREDEGGASRFFYCPKASKKDRDEGLDGRVEIFTPTIKLVYLLKNNIWEKQDLKAKHQVDTDILPIKDTEEFIITEDYKWNIESFGNHITEQFLMDGKSITETEINSTTIYQTLNSSIQKYTRTYIAELFGEMVSDIKFVSDAEQKSTTLNITLQNKDGYSQNVKNVELKGLWSINIVPSKSGHPTVKPTDLMRYLINLITPPNGVVLDPFMGSGSTGKAAVRCGVNFIGIEKEQEYMDIAKARIEHEKNKPIQGKLL